MTTALILDPKNGRETGNHLLTIDAEEGKIILEALEAYAKANPRRVTVKRLCAEAMATFNVY